jgi:hypothetical protein
MAKKKAKGGLEGSRIRVKPGINSPEFPEISLSGWTGMIIESSGKPPAQRVIIEWDSTTIAAMPAEYVTKCESQQLYYIMAGLGVDDIEVLAE